MDDDRTALRAVRHEREVMTRQRLPYFIATTVAHDDPAEQDKVEPYRR